ncbi:MAG: flavodoxin family protein [Dehalococcoidia bacterium]|nr:flavodoxin family protein [Dehalococcoidia bacterium]
MKILGLLASYRRAGNSETYLKEALMGAEEEGAAVEIIRLTNYQIRPCTACGKCATGLNPCHLKDDFMALLERIYNYDAIILSAPTYYLTAPAILKAFADRTVCEGYPTPLLGKPCAMIMTYGNRGYYSYSFTIPNGLFLKWGMPVVDRALLHATSPGDAYLDNPGQARSREMGKAVASAVKSGKVTYLGDPGICPVCNDYIIRILKDRKTIQCPTCGVRGKLTIVDEEIKAEFTEEEIRRGRWSAEQWYQHHMYHVELGKAWFAATKEKRKPIRKKYLAYLVPRVEERVEE